MQIMPFGSILLKRGTTVYTLGAFQQSFLLKTLKRYAMAWSCHGTDNMSLVDNLKRKGIIVSDGVYNAMLKVDRGDFTKYDAYMDQPVSIGYGATISAPHMHAYALENLRDHLKPGSAVLDIGSGSGYLVACFAEMVGPSGKVVGIEHIKELVNDSIKNLKKSHEEKLESGLIEIVHGDGRKGYPPAAPYDAIHIGAAGDDAVATNLLSQLKEGGMLIGPFNAGMPGAQSFCSFVRKSDGTVEKRDIMGVRYVPLTDEHKQRSSIF